MISQILSAFGLASAAGLNAYIPLLIVALLARFTPWITLPPPFDILTHNAVVVALVVLTTVETFADKIPGVDHLNDIVQTFVRPTAGAILFAAETKTVGIDPVLAAVCGLVLAFSVHAAKATARPVVSATTLGLGNPVVSTAEDVVAVATSLLAIFAPVLAAIVFVVFFVLLFVVFRRWRRRWPPTQTRGL